MPITFKNKIGIEIVTITPEADRTPCTECGGLNMLSQTALDIDCQHCDGTGVDNLFTTIRAMASYRPGGIKRWNYDTGSVSHFGDCSIKLDGTYSSILERADHINMNDLEWKFTVIRNPGEAMGQARIVLALARK